MDVIKDLLPLVIGAVVAGISAVVKAAYERRDQRLTAARQLELATKRTEFVSSWLQVSRTLADDEEFLAEANAKARAELVEAYLEAQHALADGQSAAARDSRTTLVDQVRWVLLLERRRHWLSYVAVGTFWMLTLFLWLGITEETGDGEDEIATWEYALFVAFITIVLRCAVGALVSWLERRAASPLAPTTVEDRLTIGSPTTAATSADPFAPASATESRA